MEILVVATNAQPASPKKEYYVLLIFKQTK